MSQKYTKIIDTNIKMLVKNRLVRRGRDNNKEIKKRLSLAVNEISHFNEYEFVIINDKINDTINHLVKIIDYQIFIEKNKEKINNYKIY